MAVQKQFGFSTPKGQPVHGLLSCEHVDMSPEGFGNDLQHEPYDLTRFDPRLFDPVRRRCTVKAKMIWKYWPSRPELARPLPPDLVTHQHVLAESCVAPYRRILCTHSDDAGNTLCSEP
jgi:hypothetical protein